jgi:hypothetical protein
MLAFMILVALVGWIGFICVLVPFRRRSKVLRRLAKDPHLTGLQVQQIAEQVLYETSFIWDESDGSFQR